MRLKLYMIVSILFLISSSLCAEIVTRAAFDFGSGKIKLQVADIDTDESKIVRVIYNEAVLVLLAEDAAKNEGYFSKEIEQTAVEVARCLKEKATHFGAQEYVGLATEAYRKALNGQDVVDRYCDELGIDVRIISQEEEGAIGFSALITETSLKPSNVVVWDIGGGSFQITYLNEKNELKVYQAPLGRTTTKNALITYLKGQGQTMPNPICREEWQKGVKYLTSILPEVPDELTRKLKDQDTKLIGISAHPDELRGQLVYTIADIERVLESRLDKDDKALAKRHKKPECALSELALVYSVMKKLEATSVDYIRTTSGSTSAILVNEEYWKELEIDCTPACKPACCPSVLEVETACDPINI